MRIVEEYAKEEIANIIKNLAKSGMKNLEISKRIGIDINIVNEVLSK